MTLIKYQENPAAPLSHFANPQARRSEVWRYALYEQYKYIFAYVANKSP